MTTRTEELQSVNLESLADGAAEELFDRELQRVIENIQDPNTDAEASRSITLTIKFKPREDRQGAAIALETKCKLVQHRGCATQLFFGKRRGQYVAIEHNPKQLQFDLDEETKPAKFPSRDNGGPEEGA